MTKAVLFDVDGTLLDTTEYIYQAFEYTLETRGVLMTRERMKAHMGKLLHVMYEIFAPTIELELLTNTHREFQKNHTHLATLYRGVIPTLNTLRDEGLRLGAVTTRYRTSCIATLEYAGIKELFDVVVTGDDVTKHKPDPEPLMKALRALQVEPEDAFMVGDTSIDVQAGKNAGMRTIAVTYGFHSETIAKSNPDFLVQNIEEILPILLGA